MYKISYAYCWYDNRSMIIKLYFINNVPFTFDELPDGASEDPELIKYANEQKSYSPEELFYASFYLIDEQCHPLVYDLELENPEDLPSDDYYEFDEEELS